MMSLIRDLRTVELGKTRVHRLTKVGHPGYGRTEKGSHYLTPEVAALKAARVKQLGYKTHNDYINDLIIKDTKGHETTPIFTPRYGRGLGLRKDLFARYRKPSRPTPLVDTGDLDRQSPALSVPALQQGDTQPKESDLPCDRREEQLHPLEDHRSAEHCNEAARRMGNPLPGTAGTHGKFWDSVLSIVGESGDVWAWLNGLVLTEYGQIVELTVPNDTYVDFITDRELEKSVLIPSLQKAGITKPLFIRVRPVAEIAPKPADLPPAPIDSILADIEDEIAEQTSLDPKRTNEAIKARLSRLYADRRRRLQELRPKPKGQNHITNWRTASGQKGVSGFESFGPATREDLKEAKRTFRKDSS